MSLYLIRHGETAWSISGQHTGRTDIPLTAQGEQEFRTLAERLRPVKFSRVFTSPRQRARRTCELVGLDATAQIEPDLAEWDYGDYEGQCSVDIRKHRPDWNLFRDGCPHGESPADVSDRADRLITQLRTLQGNTAVFSHGHLGRVLARALDRIVGESRAASRRHAGHSQRRRAHWRGSARRRRRPLLGTDRRAVRNYPDRGERLGRREHLAGSTMRYVYAGQVPASRPSSDFTPWLMPFHAGASVPLEAPFILWYTRPQ